MTLPLAGEQPLKFFSNLTPVSDTRLKEEVIEAEVLGQRQLLPGPLARTRTLFVTCARAATQTHRPQELRRDPVPTPHPRFGILSPLSSSASGTSTRTCW